ncbi:MAG: DUF5011 domain-containing protein [Nitrosopumilus sp.]|nr:DUF5011 domain-containing protein [Nitrosopumilus sp.]NRA06488.1 DUF5011 domain-containing protein [Nitrosopumilus sp.]
MTKKTILGIFLAGIMLCGSIPLGFSEPILVQWEKTNDINKISCDNANHVFVMRDNGRPACVYEKTAQKLGWEIVDTSVSPVEYDFPLSSETLEDEYNSVSSQNNPNTSKSNLDRIGGVTPFTSIQFPDTVNVGEKFEIISSWQYFELNEDDEVDVLYTIKDNGHQNIVPTVIGFGNDHGGGIEFLSSDGYELTTYASGPETVDYVYEKFPPFQNTEVHTDNLTFRIEQVNDFPFDHISVTIDQYEEYIISITDNEDGTFSLLTEQHTAQSLDASLSDYMMNEKETERYDKVIVEGFRYEIPFICEEDPVCVESVRQAEAQTTPYPAREHWDTLADFVELENPDDVRAFLRTANMTDAIIDEFLELYPELDTKLKTQSFHPSLSFILPQAFADNHPSKVYVHGKFLILDKDRNAVTPVSAMVCAVDKTSSGVSTVTYRKLQYEDVDACKTLGSSGSFGFFTDNKDSNRSTAPADLGVALYLDGEVVEVTDQSNNGAYSSPSRFFNNYSSSGFLGFGTTTIKSGEIIKAFMLYQYVTDANKYVEDKFRKNIDKVILRWEDTGNNRINFVATNYDNNIIQIGFDQIPYVYPTQHEYGHHFMNSIYESNGGVMLDVPSSCNNHRLNLPEISSICVWEEGFAAFFPFMVNEVGQITRGVFMNNNNVNVVTEYDIENRVITYSDGSGDDDFSSGLNVEGNVASALYDIVDETGEANTGGDSKRYDDLNSLYSQFFKAFDTRPSTSDRTIPQQSWTEFKKDWDAENTEKLERVMYLNTLQPIYNSGIVVPPDADMNIYFNEDFESGNLNKWISTTQDDEFWHIVNPTTNSNAIPIPNFPTSNHVAVSEDCDQLCTLTLKDSIDMTKFKEAKLQIYRLVDGSIETGEGIIIEVSTNGGITWTNLVSWLSPEFEDNTWHGYDESTQNLSLDNYLTSNDFKFRIVAKSSSNNEDNQIDNVRLLVKFSNSGGGGCTVGCNPPQPPTTPSLTVTSPTEGQVFTGSTILVSAKSQLTGGLTIQQYNIIIDNGSPIGIINSGNDLNYYVRNLADGNHKIQIFAIPDITTYTKSATVNFVVSLPDNTPGGISISNSIPTITLLGNQIENIEINNPYTDAGATAADAEDGNLTGDIITSNPVDTTTLGSYTITYDVTDSSGNNAIQKSRTVTVTPSLLPVATVDYSSSILTVIEGDYFLVKFDYSQTLPRTSWASFEIIDSDGSLVKRNADLKLWNDKNLFSYDGVKWGGDLYYDKAYYGSYKYLLGDSIWVKIPTFTDGTTDGDKTYKIRVTEERGLVDFVTDEVTLTIRDAD